jgi:hypothetical protein
MRARFLLIPPAIFAPAILASGHAYAGAFYLNVEQAQQLLFPKATFTEDFRTIPVKDMEAVYEDTRVRVTDPTFHLWRVSTGEYFIIDQVIGRDDTVTYAIGLDKNGVVKGIEVMECWEEFNKVRLPEWRAQFVGKHRGEVIPKKTIELISGTTLSSIHITEGVSRVLATFALMMGDPQG